MIKAIFIASIIRVALIAGLICIVIIANTQNVAINNTSMSADNSAMLDISTTTKGLLIPRMRTIERTAIVTPAEGLLVFCGTPLISIV